MRRFKFSVRVDGGLLAIIVIAVIVGTGAGRLWTPELAPRTVTFPLPAEAEVFPDTVVQPGTFSITEPIHVFLARAKREGGRPIVTYTADPGDARNPEEVGQPARFDYWLPRADGVVYHAEYLLEEGRRIATWGSPGFFTDHVEVRANDATLHFHGTPPRWVGVLMVIGFFAAFVGAAALIVRLYFRCLHDAAKDWGARPARATND